MKIAREFKDIKSLFSFLEKQAQSTLRNEGAQVAVETMQEHIQSDVYDAYDPMNPENRRMFNDGLIDPKNIEIEVVDGNTISIENIAYDGTRNVPYIVESGEGYYSSAPNVLTRGRKFTGNARRELASTNRLKNAMKNGMRKRGIDVE